MFPTACQHKQNEIDFVIKSVFQVPVSKGGPNLHYIYQPLCRFRFSKFKSVSTLLRMTIPVYHVHELCKNGSLK